MTSIDLSDTLLAKSDQLNADDLIGGPVTVTVTEVRRASGPDQPTWIFYEGCNNKPWKPCKTMRVALAAIWGTKGEAYVGRKLTLYLDPTVTFGKDAVGGIRVSHASDITARFSATLNSSKGKKKPVTIDPLVAPTPAQLKAKADDQIAKRKAAAEKAAAKIVADITAAVDAEAMNAVAITAADTIARLREGYPELAELVDAAITARNEANKE